jgi:two-component system, sensor histidine kinase
MINPRALTLVYAEDDEPLRTTMCDMLALAGLTVHACTDGTQAVQLCEAIKPDVALFDLDMPNLNGFDAARQLRRNPALLGIRLVALTGRGGLDFRFRAVDAAFDAFLCKPIALDPLLRALHVRNR